MEQRELPLATLEPGMRSEPGRLNYKYTLKSITIVLLIISLIKFYTNEKHYEIMQLTDTIYYRRYQFYIIRLLIL